MGGRFSAPPGVELKRPADTFQASSALPSAPAQPGRPKEPPQSLARRALKWAGWTGAAVTTTLSALGGVAYLGNREALHQPVSVEIHLDQEFYDLPAPGQANPPAALAQQLAEPTPQAPTTPRAQPPVLEGATLYIPGSTWRDLQGTPAARQLLDQQVQTVRQRLAEQLGRVEVPPGQVLLDAHLPLPTADRPLLHLGGFNLPSLGYRALEQGTLPLTVDYRLDALSLPLDLSVEPVSVARPLVPDGLQGGVFVGGLRVRVTPEQAAVTVRGSAQVGLDRDGSATARRQGALEGQNLTPERRAELSRKLDARQQALQRLQRLDQQGLGSYLDSAFHEQKLDFEAAVQTGRQPVEVTLHVWLSPDAEGVPRLSLAQESNLEATRALDVRLERLDDAGRRPEGWLHGQVRDLVQQQIANGVRRGVADAGAQLRERAEGEVQRLLADQLPNLTGEANGQLRGALAELQRTRLPATDATGELALAPARMSLDGDLVALTLGGGPTGSLPAELRPGRGEVALRVDREALNRQLRDVSAGGAMRWDALLGQAKAQAGLPNLSFGRDAQGKTEYPQLLVSNGQPALAFHVRTGSLASRVTIPLRLAAQDGRLELRADLGAMRLGSAQEKKLPFDALSAVSTRFLAGVITQSLQQVPAVGPLSTTAQGQEARVGVDLTQYGVNVKDARTLDNGDLYLRTGLR